MSIRVISQKLNAVTDKVDIEINCRTDYYSNRSDAWQESEKGEDYLGTTERLREVLANLKDAKMTMEEIGEDF